jgi:hypothetical protein
MDRKQAIEYLEGLFLGLLDDLERSSRILNDREIEKSSGSGKNKSQRTAVVERKRKLDEGDRNGDGSADEDGDSGNEIGDEQVSRAKIGQVGIKLRLKNRTTGSAAQYVSRPKLIDRDDQVITYPDEPFAKKESALHKLSKSADRFCTSH